MKNKVNEIQISYKEQTLKYGKNTISSSIDAAEILFELWDKNTIALKESFKVLLLNNSNRIKGVYELSQGGITGTLVDVRILFSVILKSLSVGIILCHNHPSGKLTPSKSDKQLTEKIKKASKLFDVQMLDHIILTPDGSYYSFADYGLLKG